MAKSTNLGFTIIELIIVMAIIGLLAAALATGFSRQQAASRDAKRKADLGTINTAVQSYLTEKNDLPTSASAGDSGTNGLDISSIPATGPNASFMTWLQMGGYVTRVPVDPVNNGNVNFYNPNEGGTGYAYAYNSPINNYNGLPNDFVYTLTTRLEIVSGWSENYVIAQSIRPK